jgi:hypothetical protein
MPTALTAKKHAFLSIFPSPTAFAVQTPEKI